MKQHKPGFSPIFALTIGVLAVSTASIFIRYAQIETSSLVIAAGRLFFATMILAPYTLSKHSRELAGLRKSDFLLALFSGILLAFHFATWITSLEYTSVASSVVLVTTTPLWVGLLSPLTIKEPISSAIKIGMLFALAGSTIVGLSDVCRIGQATVICPSAAEFLSGKAFLGDILALVGAWMAAGYMIIGRRLRSNVSLASYIFLVYGMASIALIVIMLLSGQSPAGISAMTVFWILLLAIIPQLLGHSIFNWALGYLSAAFVSITLLGEPVGSTILAYILLDEAPSLLKIFGAILILTGIIVASRRDTAVRAKETDPFSAA